jgi:signal peptide peptidase SppA
MRLFNTAEMLSGAWMMEPKAFRAFVEQSGRLMRAWVKAGAPTVLTEDRKSASPSRYTDDYASHDSGWYEKEGRTAIIRCEGTLMRNVPWVYQYFGVNCTSSKYLAKAFQVAADDDSIDDIMMPTDSPGGEATGISEAADAIKAASKKKDVHAAISGMAASGAYWLASQADNVTAETDSQVGCIGAYMTVTDYSEMAKSQGIKVHVIRSGVHKGVGEMGAEITKEQMEPLQEYVDGLAKMFTKSVAKGRKKTQEEVSALATGQAWLAGPAKEKGLIDEIEPASSVLGRLSGGANMAKKTNEPQAAAAIPEAVEAPDPVALERARVKSIREAFPGSEAFALEHIEAGSSLVEAKVAYGDVLRQQLAESQAALAEAKASKPSAIRPAQPMPLRAVASPLPAAKGREEGEMPQEDGINPKTFFADFASQARAYAKEQGISFTAAAKKLAAQDAEQFRTNKLFVQENVRVRSQGTPRMLRAPK